MIQRGHPRLPDHSGHAHRLQHFRGIAIGVISWTLINLVTGKAKEKKISP